jgi:hypothetical protein
MVYLLALMGLAAGATFIGSPDNDRIEGTEADD